MSFRTGNMFGAQTVEKQDRLPPEQEGLRLIISTLRGEFQSLIPGKDAVKDAVGAARFTSLKPRAESVAERLGLPQESAPEIIGTTAVFMRAMEGYYQGKPPADMAQSVQDQLANAGKIDPASHIYRVLRDLRIAQSSVVPPHQKPRTLDPTR